jgi:AcrR family transcriptional regulator
LFGSKENLLSAVVGRTFDNEQNKTKLSLPEATGDLRKDLANYAQVYEALLTENLPLIRTLIGEIHRHGDHEKKVIDGIFRPLRAELINWLKQAAARGQLREDVDPAVTADLLGGMVFTGVLRRASPNKPIEYTPADYLKTCVDVLARGIERDNDVR